MAVYEYKHDGKPCSLGEVFEIEHPITDDAMTACPECEGAITRLISRTFVSTPTTNSELKSMGFTKLVRRDKGVYENVTATGNEAKHMIADRPETLPDLKRKISD